MLGRSLRRVAVIGLPLVFLGAISGCGGSGDSGRKVMEFAYVATGGNIAQYQVSPDGQLTPLSPPTATSDSAVAIAVSGKFAYAANTSGAISQYTISTSGLLTPDSPATVAAGTSPKAIAVTPSARFVYVANEGDNTIEEYSVGTSGTLTPLTSTSTVPIDAGGIALSVSPNGAFLYVACVFSDLVDVFSIGTDGHLTALTVPSYTVSSPSSAVFSPDGNSLYVSCSTGVAQFSAAVDGSLTALNPPIVGAPGTGVDALAVAPNGDFFYAGCFNGGVPDCPVGQYSLNADGTLTPLNPPAATAGNGPDSVVVDSNERFVYAANANDGNISEFAINADGTLTALAPATVPSGGALGIALGRR